VSYLLADLDAGEAVLIDPRGADVPLLGAMLDEHQLRLRWLLRTHEHDALLNGEAAALDALGRPASSTTCRRPRGRRARPSTPS
jgi:sulfur dioxygenase